MTCRRAWSTTCHSTERATYLKARIGQWGMGEKVEERKGTGGLNSQLETQCQGLQGHLAFECMILGRMAHYPTEWPTTHFCLK
jgi:hypothetical protein